jgi:hypothetical protein
MSIRIAKWVVVCAGFVLLLAANSGAQTSSIFKVSDIEGGAGVPGMSMARCGPGIVVGFADGPVGAGGGAPDRPGVAISKNASAFVDAGTLADPTLGFGGGDSPVIACSSPSNFYYATVGFTGDPSVPQCAEIDCTTISVSNSTNTGATWGPTVIASHASFDIWQLQSPSLAIDPGNPKKLYIAYITHNFAGPNDFPGCGSGDEYILEIIASTDGGKTWNGRAGGGLGNGSPGQQPDVTCNGPGFDLRHTGELVSPAVVVSPGGQVDVVYEFVGTTGGTFTAPPDEIRFTRSVDGGNTFSTPVMISNVAIDNALPEIAVDRTASGNRGEIYVTWSGKPTGAYTDVLVSESLDAGLAFSFPRSVSAAPGTGFGRFETNPVVAVDNDGQVAVCFYSTGSNTPTSSSIYSYNCGTSFNHATTWLYQRVERSAPVGYNALTSDFLLHNDGFLTTFEVQTNGTRTVLGQKFETN